MAREGCRVTSGTWWKEAIGGLRGRYRYYVGGRQNRGKGQENSGEERGRYAQQEEGQVGGVAEKEEGVGLHGEMSEIDRQDRGKETELSVYV